MGCHRACAFLALLLILGDTHNFLFAEDPVKEVECVDSGQTVEGSKVISPTDATPTNCTASGPTKGLQCTIGNYHINHPDACKDVTERLQSRAVKSPPRLDKVCQPQLTNINLYKLSCMNFGTLPEVSLNFTFELPLCAAEFANASTAVKVDFNANRDHPQNYFHTHPICRLFNYTGSDFSHISDFSQKITMFYEWMAVGIQDHSGYPEVVYYLSLTADPSAAQLNYTIVYLDVSSKSMRLVAGAWRSNGRAHFIFLPIDHISNYRIEATSVGQAKWGHSEEVSSSTFELTDIPNYANIVTVKVTPTDRDVCDRLGYPCAPITITLQDKNTLNLPVETPRPSVPDDWRHILVITVGSLVVGVLIVATIAVLRRHLGRPAKPEGYEAAPEAPDEQPEPRQVLTITSLPESMYEGLLDLLTDRGFKTDPLKDAQCKSRMRNYKTILLIIHPHTKNYPGWRTFVELVLYIFENRPLWKRVRVISLEGQGEVCRLQDLFRGFNRNRPRLNDFWTGLEERTHVLRRPEDGDTLMAQLNEVYPGERPAVQVCYEVYPGERQAEFGQRNSRDFGMDAEEEEPERGNPCQVNALNSVVFLKAVPAPQSEEEEEPQSEVEASGVSTISDPQVPVGQINAPVSAEIHHPTHELSHFAASDEDHHLEQRLHLTPNNYNEISDGPDELLSPDGSDASSQLLPTLERGDGQDPEETTPKVPFSRDPARGPEHLLTAEDMLGNVQNLSALPRPEPFGEKEIENFPPRESPTGVFVDEGRDDLDSRQHMPHLSLLLSSSSSVVSREETENREQVLDASEGHLQGQVAMPPPAVSPFPDTAVGENSIRKGEENSYHLFLGPSSSSLQSEPRLSGVHQPCYDDRPRGDNYQNSAHGYSPSPSRVCGPDEYLSMLSQRSLGPGGNSLEGLLEEFNAVHTPPASGPARGEICRVHEGGEERNGGRRMLSGADAVCGPEDHPAFSSVRSSRQGRGDSFSMTRQNGGINEAKYLPQGVRPERRDVDFDRARQNGHVGVDDTRNPLRGRGGKEGQQPIPVAQQRAEGIRYDGHEDEQGEKNFEPLFPGDMRDNEQRERDVRGNRNVEEPGRRDLVPPARVFQRREPEEHAEGIDEDDNLDSGLGRNPDSIESQDSQ